MSTYSPIASVTLSSAQSSVTFSGIPQTYTDLVVVLSVKGTASGNDIDVSGQFNSDTSSNYSWTRIYGTGSAAGSQRGSSVAYLRIGNMAGSGYSSYSPMILNVQNYSNITTFKTMLGRPNNPDRIVDGYVNLWRSTSAITSFTVLASSGSFDTGSTFNLYGVANASITNVAKATGGDSVTTDGTYWYHTFRSSGTFTPTQALTADYLVVAGGGGGGGTNTNGGTGGGGAGGLRCTVTATGGGGSLESALSLTSGTGYTVTVGAGGAGNTSGSNSVFSSITSTGGGGGSEATGATGGSGGGSGANYSTGGAGTANQGYGGGSAASANGGSGGGGAGAVGSNAPTGGSSGNGGNGGNGVATSISGSSVTYAGGGGGASYNDGANTRGIGGSGGGGDGSSTTIAATNGTANTGGGGGGARTGAGQTRGTGGSGIVIVRYAV